MKKAEEYTNEFWGVSPIGDIVSHYDICYVIKQAQYEAIDEAVNACARLITISLDKHLILKIADQLKLEL